MADRRACIVCGADLPRYKHKYCSLACKDLANNGVWVPSPKSKMKTCIDCGKPFSGATRSIRCRPCQLLSNDNSTRKATNAYQLRNRPEPKCTKHKDTKRKDTKRKGTKRKPRKAKKKKTTRAKVFDPWLNIQRIRNRFYACIFVDGKQTRIGSYSTFEAAVQARAEALLARYPDVILIDHCAICGESLPLRHTSPYCRRCQQKNRPTPDAILADHCAICGDPLPYRHTSPYCRSCQQKKRAADGYWKRKWAEMAPEQKQHKYAQYRKNYQLRKERNEHPQNPEEE